MLGVRRVGSLREEKCVWNCADGGQVTGSGVGKGEGVGRHLGEVRGLVGGERGGVWGGEGPSARGGVARERVVGTEEERGRCGA